MTATLAAARGHRDASRRALCGASDVGVGVIRELLQARQRLRVADAAENLRQLGSRARADFARGEQRPPVCGRCFKQILPGQLARDRTIDARTSSSRYSARVSARARTPAPCAPRRPFDQPGRRDRGLAVRAGGAGNAFVRVQAQRLVLAPLRRSKSGADDGSAMSASAASATTRGVSVWPSRRRCASAREPRRGTASSRASPSSRSGRRRR